MNAVSGAVASAIREAVGRMCADGLELEWGLRRVRASDVELLHGVERRAVAGAAPSRVHEFASGRALLRELLGVDCPIPVAANRAPTFPDRVAGSLSHDAGFVVAVTSRDPRVRALGIDLATVGELEATERELILRPDERHVDAMLAFALKESAYKVWSALGGRILDHHEVKVAPSDDGRFVATFFDARQLAGYWSARGDKLLAVAAATTDE